MSAAASTVPSLSRAGNDCKGLSLDQNWHPLDSSSWIPTLDASRVISLDSNKG